MKCQCAWAAMALPLLLLLNACTLLHEASLAGEDPDTKWTTLNYAQLVSGRAESCSVGLAGCPVGGISERR